MNRQLFQRVAASVAQHMGSPWAFAIALSLVVLWALSGPVFNFSDTWQLVINTSTTIVTFLMVFLIQSTQNRDARALHLKLDGLILSSSTNNRFVDLEHATDQELDALQAQVEDLRRRRSTPPPKGT